MTVLDETHDPALESWVESANDPATDFPPQNLPFGVFREGSGERRRIGIAIGRSILDLDACVRAGLFDSLDPAVRSACRSYTLNSLMALGRTDARRVRRMVSELLRSTGARGQGARELRTEILLPMEQCALTLPADVGDYTDFYASIHHATNVGALFRPDNPLLPNYKWVPIGYHGRSSSIVVSGTQVVRPRGQVKADADAAPSFVPSRSLDYELEVGAFIAGTNSLGTLQPMSGAEDRLFGLCLLNDWSARDIQSWEYQPLGPFLAKNFATTISPWVVTIDALAPFRAARATRPPADPAPLPHLDSANDRAHGAFSITLDVSIRTAKMHREHADAARVSRGSLQDMYWTFAQLIAHHTSNGCNLRPGDLLGSGTVSGADPGARGCLLEMTSRGQNPLTLPNGETRKFLEDGDEVVLSGSCERDGHRRIGFGSCAGVVTGS